MASSVSVEKLFILVCSSGTFVTVYAAGRVKSGGMTGLAVDSTKGEPKVGWRGEPLLERECVNKGAREGIVRTYSGRLRSRPSTVRSCPTARVEWSGLSSGIMANSPGRP